jgi:hypothetical protein
MPVVDLTPGISAKQVRLPADLQRSTLAVYEQAVTQPYVVVTAEPLRLDRGSLFREADSEFGLCFVVRLTGHAPAIGILRQTERGFREYWRTVAPSHRPALRRLQAAVEEARPVPVFWRMADGRFAMFLLGGYNREHRVWYSRLDLVEPDAPRYQLVGSLDGTAIDPEPYLPTSA